MNYEYLLEKEKSKKWGWLFYTNLDLVSVWGCFHLFNFFAFWFQLPCYHRSNVLRHCILTLIFTTTTQGCTSQVGNRFRIADIVSWTNLSL